MPERGYIGRQPKLGRSQLYSGHFQKNLSRGSKLSHTKKDKENLLARTRRIRGQIEAVEKALEEDAECASILQQIAACRGAINGLMGEIMEGEVRDHVLSPTAKPGSDRARAADQLIQVLRTYLK